MLPNVLFYANKQERNSIIIIARHSNLPKMMEIFFLVFVINTELMSSIEAITKITIVFAIHLYQFQFDIGLH